MKKLFLVSLMMLAGSAWAEWVMYEKSDSGTFYYDPASIRKDGHIRRVWTLQSYSTPGDKGTMSSRVRTEYDCKEERFTNLYLSNHSEPMAGGEVLISGSPDTKWNYIPPGSIAETLLKIVCAK